MDSEQKAFMVGLTILSLFFTLTVGTIVYFNHADKVLFTSHGYDQVTVPGVSGAVWQQTHRDSTR